MDCRFLISVLTIAFTLCGCSEQLTVDTPYDDNIVLRAAATHTKAIAEAGALSEEYTICASAYLYDTNNEENTGNYFIGRPFTKGADAWRTAPTLYWPISGQLQFIALAADYDDIDLDGRCEWDGNNCYRGVKVDVADDSCLESELLFAKTIPVKRNEPTDLLFHHSQCWLQFDIAANIEGVIRIDKITVDDVYTGGTFVFDNLHRDAWWDFSRSRGHKVTVPHSEGLEIGQQRRYLNILLPEQQSSDITIHFSSKGDPDEEWSNTPQKGTYIIHSDGNMWWYGVKRIYRINMSFNEIIINVTLADWLGNEISADLNNGHIIL